MMAAPLSRYTTVSARTPCTCRVSSPSASSPTRSAFSRTPPSSPTCSRWSTKTTAATSRSESFSTSSSSSRKASHSGHFSRWTWYQNVSILDFIAAEDDGGGGDNWSYQTYAKLQSYRHKQQTNSHLLQA